MNKNKIEQNIDLIENTVFSKIQPFSKKAASFFSKISQSFKTSDVGSAVLLGGAMSSALTGTALFIKNGMNVNFNGVDPLCSDGVIWATLATSAALLVANVVVPKVSAYLADSFEKKTISAYLDKDNGVIAKFSEALKMVDHSLSLSEQEAVIHGARDRLQKQLSVFENKNNGREVDKTVSSLLDLSEQVVSDRKQASRDNFIRRFQNDELSISR
jgi:hypothetical protein